MLKKQLSRLVKHFNSKLATISIGNFEQKELQARVGYFQKIVNIKTRLCEHKSSY
jgi:hypothetical protein